MRVIGPPIGAAGDTLVITKVCEDELAGQLQPSAEGSFEFAADICN